MPELETTFSFAAAAAGGVAHRANAICCHDSGSRDCFGVVDMHAAALSSSRGGAAWGANGSGAYKAAAQLKGLRKVCFGFDDRGPGSPHQECLASQPQAAAESLVYSTWHFAGGGTENGSSTKQRAAQHQGSLRREVASQPLRIPERHEAGYSMESGAYAVVQVCPVGMWAPARGLATSSRRAVGQWKAVPALSAVATRSSSGDSCEMLGTKALELIGAGAYCHW